MSTRGVETTERVDKELKDYIEQNVFPVYAKNEPAHQLDHIQYVIQRSFKFAREIPETNPNIVYVVAAYHDIGHHVNPKEHERISAEMMSRDEGLKRFFSQDELTTIREAIEDHRSSSDHDPRSIYGKIVSTADRNTSVNSCLFRSFYYGKNLNPEMTDEQLFERAYEHLNKKFGENGYAKFYFHDDEYEQFLKEIRALLADKDKFISTQRAYITKIEAKE